jgi:hypothetical protein
MEIVILASLFLLFGIVEYARNNILSAGLLITGAGYLFSLAWGGLS